MKLHILSDLHREIAEFEAPETDADVVVLAGDIDNGARGIEWAKRSFAKPVLYVPGNHEPYDGEYHGTQEAMRSAVFGSQVELLECSERRIEGVRFLGCALWTDYSLEPDKTRAGVIEAARRMNPDYWAIRFGPRPFSPEDAIAIHRTHRPWLERKLAEPFSGPTVVVTHFAPHPGSIAPAYTGHPANPGFIVNLEELMGIAALWIHGHTHTAFDYEVRDTRIVCNPRGYPEESTGFRADLVVTV